MDQVFVFNKTYQERLEEYKNVLGGYEILPAGQLHKEWSYYLELSIEPKGWQAIWKIPHISCEELCIKFPTMVLVYVESVDFLELSANIKVLAVQGDIFLPSRHSVPLVQLWITKQQDTNFQANVDFIASKLDLLHFFYVYLLMPWDFEEDDSIDWIDSHLESRLHLFYDMKNGTISRPVFERLKWLLNKARRLQSIREKINCETEDNSEATNNDQELLEIQFQLLKIRTEVELLENPLLRTAYLKRNYKLQSTNSGNVSQNWLVFPEGKIEDYIGLLREAKDIIGNKSIKSVTTFSEAVECAGSSDSILISKGVYEITDMAGLPNNAIVRGLYSNIDNVLCNQRNGIMFDCFGNVTLESLTVDVNIAQCGFVIRNGRTTLKNCKIIGSDKTSQQGIVVQPGCHLCMIDCTISNFDVAIICNSLSDVTIRNCEISNSIIGLQIFDHCTITAEDVSFTNCKQFGVYAEMKKILKPGVYREGNFSLLETIPDLTIKNINGNNTGKCEAIVLHSTENLHIEDLFLTPELDQTIVEEDSSNGMDISTIQEEE